MLLLIGLAARADNVGVGSNWGLVEAGGGGFGGVPTSDLDLDGTYKLVLDADADTHLLCSTDDVCVWTSGGATSVTVDTNLGIPLAAKLILDRDQDSNDYITCTPNNQCKFFAGGSQYLFWGASLVQIVTGNLTMSGSTQQIRLLGSHLMLDSDMDTHWRASVDDTAVLTIGGSAALTATTASTTFATPIIMDTQISTTPTEPFACGSTTVGGFQYVDQPDDSGRGYVCLCIATGDDGAGTPNAWDWVRMDDHATTCPAY